MSNLTTDGEQQATAQTAGSDRDQNRIHLARRLIVAWGDRDVAALRELYAENVEIDDTGHCLRMSGLAAVCAFFERAAEQHQAHPEASSSIVPVEFWVNDSGVAARWTMSSTVSDDAYGPEHRGAAWTIGGVSTLDFDEHEKIVREVDYWSGPSGIRNAVQGAGSVAGAVVHRSGPNKAGSTRRHG